MHHQLNTGQMGVDVGISIRVITEAKETTIAISDQDNSLESLLLYGYAKYTSIAIPYKEVLDYSEISLLDWNNKEKDESDDDEMMLCKTDVMPAQSAFLICSKLYKSVSKIYSKCLATDLLKIAQDTTLSEDQILKKQAAKAFEYRHFIDSLSKTLGILELAASLEADVQILAEYY